MSYRTPVFSFALFLSLGVLAILAQPVPALADPDMAALDVSNSDCLACHSKQMPGLYKQWAVSRHAQVGVGCIDCHAAEPDDVDGFLHHDQRI